MGKVRSGRKGQRQRTGRRYVSKRRTIGRDVEGRKRTSKSFKKSDHRSKRRSTRLEKRDKKRSHN